MAVCPPRSVDGEHLHNLQGRLIWDLLMFKCAGHRAVAAAYRKEEEGIPVGETQTQICPRVLEHKNHVIHCMRHLRAHTYILITTSPFVYWRSCTALGQQP